jgi:SAM-dependent methyltransferase
MLEGLRESGVGSATGFEVSEQVVLASRFVPDERFRIQIADLTEFTHTETFDIVLLHDVLEHVEHCAPVLLAARRSLAPGGRVFVSFPPYWSPFGGHQHLAAGWARIVPYVHYLPARFFFRLAAPVDNEYMSREGSLGDLISVRRTRLSLAKAEREFAAAGLRPVASEFFLLRPEYTVRYGIRSQTAGMAGRLPGLREVLVNGAFYLLAADD